MASGRAVLVDVRDTNELAQRTIPGSVHASRRMLELYADPASSMRAPHDPTLRFRRALGAVAATLRQMGYTDVAHLDGGFKAWVAAGKPVDR